MHSAAEHADHMVQSLALQTWARACRLWQWNRAAIILYQLWLDHSPTRYGHWLCRQYIHYTIVSSLTPSALTCECSIHTSNSVSVVARVAHIFIFTQCNSHEHRGGGGNHGASVWSWIGVTVWCCAVGSGGKVIALCSWDVIEWLQPQLPGDWERDTHSWLWAMEKQNIMAECIRLQCVNVC